MGNDKAPGLFTEGSYRYSVVPASLDATNHHPNLLAQRFLFLPRRSPRAFSVLAVSALPCLPQGPISLAPTLSSVVPYVIPFIATSQTRIAGCLYSPDCR